MNMNLYGFLWLICAVFPAHAYESTYERIQWEPRYQTGLYYCLDITDAKFQVLDGLQAITCGTDLYEFSPRDYVRSLYQEDLPHGSEFYWRVWSVNGYGGKGFEGKVTVGKSCGLPYQSDIEQLQWGCRFQDDYYCIDLYDHKGKAVQVPAACGDNLHSYNPQALLDNLGVPGGRYYWKVWSEHVFDYTAAQRFFEGYVDYQTTTFISDARFQPLNHLVGLWQISYVDNNQVIDLRFQLENHSNITDALQGRDMSDETTGVYVVYEANRDTYLLTAKTASDTRYIRFSQNSRTQALSGYTYVVSTDMNETQAPRFPIQGRHFNPTPHPSP